ncbi:MAG: hypothetical protein ACJA0M_001624 [Chitinophagales bacterium]|jgi:uncharacterized protein YehS (DUF1456 family)|tara:strand:- start:1033 stop:1536 length:504 start_codon:yes stop_codon:yes gene_type:complete
MDNNDVLRRIRYVFDFDDKKMMAIFTAADFSASRQQVSAWLKKEDAEGFEACDDKILATFLNGLINDKRGKRDGDQPEPETRLTNNIVFMKLKIALNLKSDDILALLDKANFALSNHELSALFRKFGHKHYRECKDQVLRNFLNGLRIEHRQETLGSGEFAWKPLEL